MSIKFQRKEENEMKKVIILSFILLAVLGVYAYCFAMNEEVNVILNKQVAVIYNGEYQEFSNVNGTRVYPLSYEGTTYLPVRSISSLFNSRIKWDGQTNSVTIGEGDLDTSSSKSVITPSKGANESIKVLLNKDIKIYYASTLQTFKDANGKVVYPLSYNGTTYLPVRAVSNLFDLKIDWDGRNNNVLITSNIKENNDLNINNIKIEVNNKELIVELENNQATKELVQKLNSGNVVVKASEYGGFEKVGSLGFFLTKDDKQITTKAGDIVLYQGSQISLFYNSNSWSYTKLGRVTNVSDAELKDILGTGDVTLTLKK